MTGIGIAHILGDILYFPGSVTDQKFLGFADSEFGQIFVDRTSKIPGKKPGQILWCDEDFLTECVSGKIFHISGMDNGKNRPNIFFPGWLLRRIRLKSSDKLQKHLITFQRQKLRICWCFLMMKNGLINQLPDRGSFFVFKKSK